MKKGIDISYHQGNIDFNKVKESGIEFVIIREGYRQNTDIRFFEYVNKAKEAELEIPAIYHFSYALNKYEAIGEAKLAVSNAQKAGLDNNTRIFFDFEYDTVKKANTLGVKLDRSACIEHTKAFCDTVLSLGYQTGIYTNLDYYKYWYDQTTLTKYPIWLADYTGEPDFNCIIQQYSSTGKVPGINGNVDMNYFYEENFKMSEINSERSRSKVIELATSWIGKNEKDGTHKEIIDIYNLYAKNTTRKAVMKYTDPWCACTWSALAIKLGYTDIMPVEISCGYLIEEAKKMGIWQENDNYVPNPGDAILYDWQDNGNGDNTGWPDHVGIVEYVNPTAGYITVIEGNYDDSVKKRTISINGKFIRGFITPKYTDNDIVDIYKELGVSKDIETLAREVISGLWGSGESRKAALEAHGHNYQEVQNKVNEILNVPKKQTPETKEVVATCAAKNFDLGISGVYKTTADLYCRNDAGSNKKALCIIPKGTKVTCYGYYNEFGDYKWPYIQFMLNNIQYTGFSSGKYLQK